MIDTRNRINEGLNRARLRLEVRRGAFPALTIAVFLAIGLAIGGYIVSHVSKSALTGTYTARFQLEDATGVVPGVDEVRFRGMPAGTITKIKAEHGTPVITAKIQKRFRGLYKDVRAQLRPSTALQDMFLDITDRGTPAAGRLGDGDVVPATQTQVPVNISDVLNTFGPSTRVRLRELLDQLGNGMKDRGRSLQRIFVEATPFIRVAGDIAQQVRERAPLVKRLVHNTAVLTRRLGDNQAELRTLVKEGAATLGTLQDGSADLDATLRELPPTLRRASSSLAAVRGVLPPVDRAVRSLYPVADRLSASLTSLRALGEAANPAIADLQKPVARLTPLARALEPLSSQLGRGLTLLQPQIDTVDKVTRDLAGCKKGIQGFFQWNASISKFGDARGPIPRGNVVMGAQSSSTINDPHEYAPQACTPGQVIGGRVPVDKDKH
jgi:phospholipid/cholesterol/gamma-HCH transport system substrate-binding protein